VGVADTGKPYENEQSIYVAPHDAKIEGRSGRAESPS
jgi:hypothetical protein